MGEGLRIGVLVSSKGNKLQAIFDACKEGLINGRVVFVCSDNPNAQALTRAKRLGLPHFVVDYDEIRKECRRRGAGAIELPDDCNFDDIIIKQRLYSIEQESAEALRFRLATRVLAEERMLRKIAEHPFDLLVLAGYIRKLTPYFIDKVNLGCVMPRIMNLHATICPAFPGIDGYGQTLRHGCKIGGCTVHFVDFGVDSGPIIDQEAFKIQPGDTVDSIKKKGLDLECKLYPKCISLYAKKRLKLGKTETGRTFVDILPEA